jgi:hypothetical protein
MRQINFIYLLILIGSLSGMLSCSDDDANFRLSQNKIQLALEGVLGSVVIEKGSGSYEVKSDNENIARAEIIESPGTDEKCKYVRIIPVSKGNTRITIFDGQDKQTVEVTVVDPYLVLTTNMRGSEVSLKNRDKESAVKKELAEEVVLDLGYAVMMAKNKEKTLYLYKTVEDIKKGKNYLSKGTYRFEKINDIPYLFLTIGNKTCQLEVGGRDLSGIRMLLNFYESDRSAYSALSKKTSESRISVTFIEDLTEKYNIKYPDAGIEKVQNDYTMNFYDREQCPFPVEE